MQTKPFIFALGLGLLLLSGCVASVGPEYGHYAPPRPVYYTPAPVIVVPVPYYRPYRSHHFGYRYEGNHNRHGGGGRHGGYSRQRHT